MYSTYKLNYPSPQDICSASINSFFTDYESRLSRHSSLNERFMKSTSGAFSQVCSSDSAFIHGERLEHREHSKVNSM